MSPTKISQKQRKDIVAAYDAGTPVVELSNRYGISGAAVYDCIAAIRAAEAGMTRKAWSAQRREKCIALFEQGYSNEAVSATLGFSRNSVAAIRGYVEGIPKPTADAAPPKAPQGFDARNIISTRGEWAKLENFATAHGISYREAQRRYHAAAAGYPQAARPTNGGASA